MQSPYLIVSDEIQEQEEELVKRTKPSNSRNSNDSSELKKAKLGNGDVA